MSSRRRSGRRSTFAAFLFLSGAIPVVTLAQQDQDGKPFSARHNIEIQSLLMLDLSHVDGLYTDRERDTDTHLRRARLGISGDFNKYFDAALAVDFNREDSELELHELQLRYRHSKDSSIEIGYLKPAFGLENSISSRRLSTLERSMASKAFAPGRDYGVMLSTKAANHYLAVGAFTDKDDDSVYDLSGRITFAPVKSKRTALHFGINAAYRNNEATQYRIRDSGILQDGDNFFKSGRYNPESISTIGLEAAWQSHSFSIQSEWFKQDLSLDTVGESDPGFSGGYIKIGMILNNGRRKYSKGKFGKVKESKHGPAIELVAAAGQINTVFEDKGKDATDITVGMNYRFSPNIRIAGQLQRVSTVDEDGIREKGNGALLRLQIDLESEPGKNK